MHRAKENWGLNKDQYLGDQISSLGGGVAKL